MHLHLETPDSEQKNHRHLLVHDPTNADTRGKLQECQII